MESFRPPGRRRRKTPLHLWLALAFTSLFALTAVVPDWLEALGIKGLDSGDGGAEAVILFALGAVAAAEGLLTVRAFRRNSLTG